MKVNTMYRKVLNVILEFTISITSLTSSKNVNSNTETGHENILKICDIRYHSLHKNAVTNYNNEYQA